MSHRLLTTIILLSLFASLANAEEVMEKTVRERSFILGLVPPDSESKDALSGDLFVTTQPGRGWRLSGACQVIHTIDGPKFKKTETVPADGIYYYRSRAGDAAGKSQDPDPNSPPQLKVIVDTTRPLLTLGNPIGSETVIAGREMRILWSAADQNFPENPIDIHFSNDNGRSWQPIIEKTANDGEEKWIVPRVNSKEIFIRITAIDRAGNHAEATTTRPVIVISEDELKLEKNPAPQPSPKPAPKPKPAPAPIKKPKPEKKAAVQKAVPKTTNKKTDENPDEKYPWLDANDADVIKDDWRTYTPKYAAYTSYVIAGNLVRQGKLKDSLRYYRDAVVRDGDFGDAWNDLALVYKQIGDFDKAYGCIEKALRKYPTAPIYQHTAGEVMQARGFWLLKNEMNHEDHAKAVQSISFAIKFYAKSIELSEKQGSLASRAATFFRLGEICYFYHQDPTGAKRYWQKVTELHTPTPNLDDVIYDTGTPREEATREILQRHTEMKVRLQTWQNWARVYLRQLEYYEQSGVMGNSEEHIRKNKEYMAPPAVDPRPQTDYDEREAYPKGEGIFLKPYYGSKNEPGEISEQVLPAPENEEIKRPEYMNSHYGSEPMLESQPAVGKQENKESSNGFLNYKKYFRRNKQSQSESSKSSNTYMDYSKR